MTDEERQSTLSQVATMRPEDNGRGLAPAMVRPAGPNALRASIDAGEVNMADFEAAPRDTRASVPPGLEREYEQIRWRLRQDAMSARAIGFVSPGMLTPRSRGRTAPIRVTHRSIFAAGMAPPLPSPSRFANASS